MKPPYQVTTQIMVLVASISEKIGEINSLHLNKPETMLRRTNRIRTIQSSLEIEGNTLTIQQVTDLLDNKCVIAPRKDILEVKNAIKVYDQLDRFDVFDCASICLAHNILMKDLVEQPGKIRTSSVGIIKGDELAHLAPPGKIAPELLDRLFDYLREDDDLLLIKSCVFHYEFEFIHPFMDGNGRIGRLWQSLILRQYSPVFDFLPIEILIKERQQDYYRVLGESDKQGESTSFIEFMLRVINDTLADLLKIQNVILKTDDRILHFKEMITTRTFSRQDYLRAFKSISSATASRDLKVAVDRGMLIKNGDKRTAVYHYVD